jgi:hypothetical protein
VESGISPEKKELSKRDHANGSKLSSFCLRIPCCFLLVRCEAGQKVGDVADTSHHSWRNASEMTCRQRLGGIQDVIPNRAHKYDGGLVGLMG